MNNHLREEALFAEAIGLPVGRRRTFLEEACPDDPALRARVEALLHEHNRSGGVLDAPPNIATHDVAHVLRQAAPAEDTAGAKIGRYKLLQKLGEGGCGTVFMAQQEEPVRRRVALKIIKLGMDTKEVIARFEAERQALALMDHPNIASVLDAGATDTGRPYFVMELVRGVPVTKYCDEQNLSTVERLMLFTQVCHAVQHAHQKGIIHRDLKPSNILVTLHDGVPVPKVIDFGIAKATQGRLTDATVFTAFEQFIGTPAYMSPEQAELSGLDIDTRSDIYSLGVLLYELLTSRLPFDPKSLVAAGLDEIRRIIREVEPPRPSIRLSTLGVVDRTAIAKQRATLPAQLSTLIRGDLDWIVMRCLEKDRARRYETANSLAQDIGRHLNNEPVAARPPSTAYVLQKLVRRNKFMFAAACGIVGALTLGLVLAMWALQRERVARQRADSEAARSAQVARFTRDMLAGVGPQIALGRDTKLLRAILDETGERLPRELQDQPEVEADLRETLGNVYRDISEFRSSALMHETALQIRRETFGAEHPAIASSLHNLGELHLRQDKLAEAETALRAALTMREKLLGNDHPATTASRAALGHVLLRKAQLSGVDKEPGNAASSHSVAEKPAVVRIAQVGGRVAGQPFSSGDALLTARLQGAIEREFNADGVRVGWTVYPSGPATNELLSHGHADFVNGGTAGAIGEKRNDHNYKALFAVKRFGETQHLVVRADSPYHSLAELRGKRFATIEGGGHQKMLYRLFEKHGFTEKDFEIVRLESGTAILNALVAGETDGHVMTMPFDLEMDGTLRTIERIEPQRDAVNVQAFLISREFEQRYPAIVQRMVTALVKTAAWSSDETNRSAVLELWAKPDRSTAALENSWAGKSLKERLSPLMDDYFYAALRRSLDEAQRTGAIGSEVSLLDWAEPKYLSNALRELKLEGYWPEFTADGQPKRDR